MDEMEFENRVNPMLAEAETLLQNSGQYTEKDYRSVCQAVTQFENHCKDYDYSYSEIEDARFFLCAFLDEKFIWKKSLLSTFNQSHTNKNYEFFDRLKRRRKNPKKNVDLLELAYLCLSLGFHGKFSAASERDNLIAEMDALYSSIRDVRPDKPYQLTVGTREPEENPWRLPPVWITALVGLIILISIFISYDKKLNQYSTPSFESLKTLVQTDQRDHEN